jgi:excisionase family DNA binding protein
MVQSLLLEQAAELLGVSRRTVYYRIRDGRLRTVRARCGSQRVLIDSIEELLREQAERARRRSAGVRIVAADVIEASSPAAAYGTRDAE